MTDEFAAVRQTEKKRELMIAHLNAADNLLERVLLDVEDLSDNIVRWRERHRVLNIDRAVQHLTLGMLIHMLETYEGDSEEVLPMGLGLPHSYRGDYNQVAFPILEGISVSSMLEYARSALGTTYQGYKGGDGEFIMKKETDCYVADWGSTGDILTNMDLIRMTRGEYVAVES